MLILNGNYFKIARIAKQDIYQFIKNTGESLIDYHFSSYLNYYLKRYNIKILEHHFSCRKIEGLTLINEDGVSFSYEKDNSTEKQNFTIFFAYFVCLFCSPFPLACFLFACLPAKTCMAQPRDFDA